MSKYLLSIVIPVRNSVETIKHTVNNVLDVINPSESEVIIIDNASEDGTTESLESFRHYPNFKLILNNTLVSMSENWERGLEHTSGNYITYIGADDGLIRIATASLIKLIVKRQYDVAY